MNKGVLPPNYNDAIKNDVAPTADIRGAGWVLTEPNTDYQQGFPGEFDDTRLGQLRRSGSKSSCSSGSSSNVRFSNGSGMYTMADQNYNLAKELPPGWELRFLSTGRMYYCHLPTDTQHWNHPHEKADLPPGWERVYNNEYGEYFVNHITKTAQFLHPGSLPNPVSGEDHAQALAAVKQRKILQEKAHSSTYVPPSQYLIEEIPIWLQEYAQSPVNQYEWVEESAANLDKYQTMMTRLYRQELKECIEQYEEHRNRIIRELEERMQLHDLSQAPSAAPNLETYV